MADRSSKAELALFAMVFGSAFVMLAAEWSNSGMFEHILSPVISKDTLFRFIPKLSNDFDQIALHHFSYRPGPYLYWYASALGIATCIGLCVSLLVFRCGVTPDRQQFMLSQLSANRTWKNLMGFVILIGLLIWPWIGPSLITVPRLSRKMPPGAFHDLFMCLLLGSYSMIIVATPLLTLALIQQYRQSL